MNTILALSISANSVKAVIARAAEPFEIIGVGHIEQKTPIVITNPNTAISACEKALLEAETAAQTTAKLAVIGITSELIKDSTTAVHYTRKSPTKPITDEELNVIIEKVQEKAEAYAKSSLELETGNPNPAVKLINSAIVSLTIDGRSIDNPVGVKGSDVMIQFYTAFAPLSCISAIEKICAELNLELLAITTNSFAAYRTYLGEDSHSNFSGIILDINHTTTDLVIVINGSIQGTKNFNLGANIKNPDIWLTAVEVAIEELNLASNLPNDIYLCGNGANSSKIQEALALSDWYRQLPFSRRPTVNLISPQTLPNFTFQTNSQVNYSYIATLGLLCIGADTLANTPESNSLRTKIAKILQK